MPVVHRPATRERTQNTAPLRAAPRISVVITAYNEGDEVLRTIESVRENTRSEHEILLVDDGSTDGCCTAGNLGNARLLRHESRMGVGYSRDRASDAARGDVLVYLDGHQRIGPNCLDRCAELALERTAVVTPDICGFDDEVRLHGADFIVCPKRKYFAAEWKERIPRENVNRISSLRAPAYVVPREIYPTLRWSTKLRGWGGSEAAISLKAFFAGVQILHLCGPLVQHRFKKTFHYGVCWPEVWRNHAIIARICFDDRTWQDYWLPEVFRAHLTDEARRELESDAIRIEHEEFAKHKTRGDREFWTRLVFESVPSVVASPGERRDVSRVGAGGGLLSSAIRCPQATGGDLPQDGAFSPSPEWEP